MLILHMTMVTKQLPVCISNYGSYENCLDQKITLQIFEPHGFILIGFATFTIIHLHLLTTIILYIKYWFLLFIFPTSIVPTRGVATVRHFRQVPTHNIFHNIFLLMKNDKQRITYFNYVCFMFIVLMTSFHKLKDKHLQWALWP